MWSWSAGKATEAGAAKTVAAARLTRTITERVRPGLVSGAGSVAPSWKLWMPFQYWTTCGRLKKVGLPPSSKVTSGAQLAFTFASR